MFSCGSRSAESTWDILVNLLRISSLLQGDLSRVLISEDNRTGCRYRVVPTLNMVGILRFFVVVVVVLV